MDEFVNNDECLLACMGSVGDCKIDTVNCKKNNVTMDKSEQHFHYCVNCDDTIERVAAKFMMTPNKLISLNKLQSRTLFVNQILKVKYTSEKDLQTHDTINEGKGESPRPGLTEMKENDSSETMLLPLHCKDNHLKVMAKYITDTEGMIKGKLLLTPAFFTFIPAFGDPVVMEYGDENFTIHLPNNKIACVSMYNDSEMMVYKRSQRIDMTNETISSQDPQQWISLPNDSVIQDTLTPSPLFSTFSDDVVLATSLDSHSHSFSLDDFLSKSVCIPDLKRHHSMKFADHKYLCVIASPRYRKIKAVYQKDDEYWFMVPKNYVYKLMNYFLTQAETKYDIGADVDSNDNWISESTSGENNDSKQLKRRKSFAKVEVYDEPVGKMKNKINSAIKTLRSKSIQWEIINTDMDFEEDVYDDSDDVESKILDSCKIKELMKHLPAETTGATWELIYTTDRDGWSLGTLYRNVYNSTRGCCLLLIKDSNDVIMGAMCNSYIRMSSSFYGNGTTFIFRWNPAFEKFSYSHKNNYFLYGQPEFFAIGCSNFGNAIRIERNLFSGMTEACDTFNSPPLVPLKTFEISNLEVWSFY